MKRALFLAVTGMLVVSSAAAAPPSSSRSASDADFEVEMVVGDAVHIDGGSPQGINPDYFGTAGGGGECTKDVDSYCEWTLVHVITEVPADVDRGRLRTGLNITLTTPDSPISDFDIAVWESNPEGERLSKVGTSGGGGYVQPIESMAVVVSTTPEVMDAWFLVDAIYYLGGVNYDLDITFG
jgi:hypothetical protein